MYRIWADEIQYYSSEVLVVSLLRWLERTGLLDSCFGCVILEPNRKPRLLQTTVGTHNSLGSQLHQTWIDSENRHINRDVERVSVQVHELAGGTFNLRVCGPLASPFRQGAGVDTNDDRGATLSWLLCPLKENGKAKARDRQHFR